MIDSRSRPTGLRPGWLAFVAGTLVVSLTMMHQSAFAVTDDEQGALGSRLEHANAKSSLIASSVPAGEYHDQTYGLRVEIQSISKIEGGVEILARAWRGGSQLGFGQDGSVEIERFRIYNPPTHIEDPSGPVIRRGVDAITGDPKERRLREDPTAAIKKDLAHTISIVGKQSGKIVKGKVGNTTSTFRPDADLETTSVDGRVAERLDDTGASWSTLVSGGGTEAADSVSIDENIMRWGDASGGNFKDIFRGFFLFDTSALPDDATVTSATLSLYGVAKADPGSNAPNINVYSSAPASNTSLAAGDYDSVGSTAFSTAISYSGWSTSGFNDFSLNSNGIANITKTGVSKFSTRNANYDVANSAPTWVSLGTNTYMNSYVADRSGTSEDPKLIVEHFSTAPVGVRKSSTDTTASDATVNDDDELAVALGSNEEYEVHGVIFASSTSQIPDIKVAFTVPAGAEMDIGIVPSTSEQAELLQASGIASDGIAIPANQPILIQVSGTVRTGSTSGALKFQWAQNASDATSIGVLRGSYLRVNTI